MTWKLGACRDVEDLGFPCWMLVGKEGMAKEMETTV